MQAEKQLPNKLVYNEQRLIHIWCTFKSLTALLKSRQHSQLVSENFATARICLKNIFSL